LQALVRQQQGDEFFEIISHLPKVIITMLLSLQSCGQLPLRLQYIVPINDFPKKNRMFQTRDLISEQ
jgi:hypothetical protein